MTNESSGDAPILPTVEVFASEDSVREELERVLSSQILAQPDSLKRFLRHSVEAKLDGREDELKELTIGSAVFGRGESYDPRLDPIVRVQATRLRGKLREYYYEEGGGSSVTIELPKGSYVPNFRGPESRRPESRGALERARQDRSVPILVPASDPDFAPVKNDARFIALLEEIRLER